MPGGWQRDLPDQRDLSFVSGSVRRKLLRLKAAPHALESLRDDFPMTDAEEGAVNSVATACTGLVDYFLFRIYDQRERRSALFLDKTACRLNGAPGGCALSIRTVLRVLARFGVP